MRRLPSGEEDRSNVSPGGPPSERQRQLSAFYGGAVGQQTKSTGAGKGERERDVHGIRCRHLAMTIKMQDERDQKQREKSEAGMN